MNMSVFPQDYVECYRTSWLDRTMSVFPQGYLWNVTEQVGLTYGLPRLLVECYRTSWLDMNLSCVSPGLFCSPHCHHGHCRYISGHAGGDLWPRNLCCALQHRGGGMLWTLGAGFKLQVLVYYTLPPTTVITGCTVSLWKLSISSLLFELQWKTGS